MTDRAPTSGTVTCHKCGVPQTTWVPGLFWWRRTCTVCAAQFYVTREGGKWKTQISKPKNGVSIP